MDAGDGDGKGSFGKGTFDPAKQQNINNYMQGQSAVIGAVLSALETKSFWKEVCSLEDDTKQPTYEQIATYFPAQLLLKPAQVVEIVDAIEKEQAIEKDKHPFGSARGTVALVKVLSEKASIYKEDRATPNGYHIGSLATEMPAEYAEIKTKLVTHLQGAAAGSSLVAQKPKPLVAELYDALGGGDIAKYDAITKAHAGPTPTDPEKNPEKKGLSGLVKVAWGAIGFAAVVGAICGAEQETAEKREKAEARGEKFQPKKRWFLRAVAAFTALAIGEVLIRGEDSIVGKHTQQLVDRAQGMNLGFSKG